ncbi:hypothetical protein [Peribacillus muralis]
MFTQSEMERRERLQCNGTINYKTLKLWVMKQFTVTKKISKQTVARRYPF